MLKKLNQTMCFMGCLMLTVFLFCGCTNENDLEIVTDTASDAWTGNVEMPDADVIAEKETIYVQVTGAVKNPGVYELPAGSRVFEVLQKAGGMTETAAADSINQAAEVKDGEMIVLYTQEEWDEMHIQQQCGAEAAVTINQLVADGRVNINTADEALLCTIPGIGQTRAQSILTYREEHGAFGSIEEIKQVNGIKDGLFQKIKDSIKVE